MTVQFGALFVCDAEGCSNKMNVPPHYYSDASEFIGAVLTIMSARGWDIKAKGLTFCPECNPKNNEVKE